MVFFPGTVWAATRGGPRPLPEVHHSGLSEVAHRFAGIVFIPTESTSEDHGSAPQTVPLRCVNRLFVCCQDACRSRQFVDEITFID